MADYIPKRLFKSRVVTAGIIILGLFSLLLYNLYHLQVTQYSDYQTTSDGNRFDLISISPQRGLIYDSKGQVLAANRTSYNLELIPDLITNRDTTIKRLQSLLNLDTGELSDLENKIKANPNSHRLVLRANLFEEEVALIASELYRIPEVEIVGRLVRYYPENDLFSHVIGYVGTVDSKDLGRIDKQNYLRRDDIGKTGIEKYYEPMLRGKLGLRRVEVNAHRKILASTNLRPALAGDDIMLTVDTHLQRIAYEALAEHQGAVVALDPRSGSVLAMVSKPTFNPNLFTYNFSERKYQELNADASFNPFFHRAVSGQYAPGSTLKPVVALAALKFKIVNPSYRMYAGPYYQIPGFQRHYRDWREQGHGWVDLGLSITQSCDVFFYDVAYRMGVAKLSSFLQEFGLGGKTNIDTASEASGLVPNPHWKHSERNEQWFPAETIMMGIGQGYLLATPLQLAVMTATLANRGKGITPYLVQAHRKTGYTKWQKKTPQSAVQLSDNSEQDWDYVIDAMVDTVHRPNGTAYKIGQFAEYKIAGKTGTVQTRRLHDREKEREMELQRELRDHAMFIGFAPPSKPEIAIAVVVEHSGSGSKYAAPVARRVLDAYFGKTTLTALEHTE